MPTAKRSPVDPRVREVADRLAALIRERGFSQREVEQQLELSPKHLNKVLRGVHALKVEHVFQVLDAIGVEPAAFWLSLAGSSQLDVDALVGRVEDAVRGVLDEKAGDTR